MAKDLGHCDYEVFWNKISKLNDKKIPLPDSIDNVAGVCNNATMWREHYQQLLNSFHSTQHKKVVMKEVEHCEYSKDMEVHVTEHKWSWVVAVILLC